MDINQIYSAYLSGSGISTDSRNITPGCLFFALKGDNFNGNRFAIEALEKGASLAVVDEELPEHPKVIRVNDVLAALQMLANYHRRQCGFRILAITGSNGKTTTKELCKAVLSQRYKVLATEGNLNNHIGVPLTLLSMDHSIEIGIVEMGANHPGEIAALCEIAQPDFGLITNVGKAHLEGFGGIHGVAKAKGELFTYLMAQERTIFLNEGNPYVCRLVPENYSKTVCYNGQRGIQARNINGEPALKFEVEINNKTYLIATNLLGSYNVENVLAACCVGSHFNIDTEDTLKALENYHPRNNRSQLIDTGKNRIYMDAYNANPSSMLAALTEFIGTKDDRKMFILGEMRELGESSEQEHRTVIRFLKDKKVHQVICIGNAFKKPAEDAGYRYFDTVDNLNEWLLEEKITNHFIFIKGSRSNRLERAVAEL